MRKLFVVLVLSGMCSAPAMAQDTPPTTMDDYLYQFRYRCVGPFAKLAAPQPVELGKKKYLAEGFRMSVQERDADNEAHLGILSAIKDISPETRSNLLTFFDWFAREKVEAVIVNGDLSLNEEDLESVFARLGESGLPIFVEIGNSESAGAFSRSFRNAAKTYPNLINLNMVRHVVGDDFELVSLPGYYDKRFSGQSACFYKTEDIDPVVANVQSVAAPLILVSHGPPKGTGDKALDRIPSGDSVGDPALNELIRRAEIHFGIFGHILEAGGAIVGQDLSSRVKEGVYSPYLYLNAGTANGFPWSMNDGQILRGMAAVMHLKGNKALVKYQKIPQ